MPTQKAQPTLPTPNPDQIIDIPVEQLLLDAENARLAWRVQGEGQDDLVKLLWTEMAVDEVALSIAENGFYRSEPLFAIIKNPKEQDPEKRRYIVIVGNRRLAAVRLLRDEKMREKVKATDLPVIDTAKMTALGKLPCVVYPTRQSLWAAVGFRHINGIKPWDSFSKAKYIAEVHEAFHIPLDEIAQKIGDRHSTVKRLYRGYKVLEQAEAQAGLDKEDRARRRFSFSHLYIALDQKEFQGFLGVESETSLEASPVPQPKLKELGELMTWLYGKKSAEIEPVVKRQNPDLNTLREVISNPDSLAVLRRGYSLERSQAVAIGDKQRFRNSLTSAKVELQNAKATVTTGYSGEEDLFRMLGEILLYAETIREEMKAKRDEVSREPKGRYKLPDAH